MAKSKGKPVGGKGGKPKPPPGFGVPPGKKPPKPPRKG